MKPKNAAAWRLRTTADGHYEDGWLIWNVNWSAHDDAVRNGCSIEYAVPEIPQTKSLLLPTPQIPSFQEWHQKVYGCTYKERCCRVGMRFEDSLMDMLQASADYATFAMRFAAEFK